MSVEGKYGGEVDNAILHIIEKAILMEGSQYERFAERVRASKNQDALRALQEVGEARRG